MKILIKLYAWSFIVLFSIIFLTSITKTIFYGMYGLILTIPLFLISLVGLKAGIDLHKKRSAGWVISQIILMFLLVLCSINVIYGFLYDSTIVRQNIIDIIVILPLNIGLFFIRKHFFDSISRKKEFIAYLIGALAGILLFICRHTILSQ